MEKRKHSGEIVPVQQQLEPVGHLTEEAIKRVTLRYLKGYYKYRPTLAARPLEGGGYLEAKLGVQTPDGIIADGFLSYRTADEELFTATFEATSYLKRGEVRFRAQWVLLLLDSLAVGLMTAAVAFAVVFVLDALPIRDFGFGINIAGLFVLASLVGAVFSWLLRKRHRYRYIFAVEQFKQYHANEQWVAVAEDAFEGANDVHLDELKHQCVRNGFGLILVQPDYKPMLVITPARQEMFKNRRNLVRFLPQSQFVDRMAKQVQSSADRLITAPLKSLNLQRYRRSYFYQLVSFSIAITIIGVVFWQAWQKKEIVIYESKEYIQGLESNLDDYPLYNRFPEAQELSSPDTLDWPHVQPFIDLQRSYLEDLDAGFSSLRQSSEGRATALPPPNRFIEADTISNVANSGLLITSQGRIVATYDCTRIRNISEERYFVQDSQHATLEAAIERVNRLGFYGFSPKVLWMACFSNSNDGYVVFFDLLYENRRDALVQLNVQGDLLEARGLFDDDLRLRQLSDF